MTLACECRLGKRRGLNEGKMVSVSTSVWEKAVPPVLALKPDNLVTPSMSLAPFLLLSQHWSSEQVSLSESTSCTGPLRGMPGPAAAFHFTQPQSSCQFQCGFFYISSVIELLFC